MRKFIVLLFIILFISSNIEAQVVIEKPNVAEQTQPELKIERIIFYDDSVVVNLSIENKLASGGWYCADKKIYIEDAKLHQRTYLVKSHGIPTCPLVHNFTKVGEVLNFSLVFPQINTSNKLINLVEDCNQSCFSFKGIILDKNLNDDINIYSTGVEHYAANRTKEAADCFMKVVEEIPEFPTHVYGYSYYNLIRIYKDKGDNLTMRFWFDQLERSTLPDKQYFIEALKKEGIINK